MKQIKDLVSIILPVNNAELHLKECLTSILLQTYTNIEIIAIDDNSRDNSWHILKAYQKRDKRLKISKNIKKYGLTVTLNRAVNRAKGSYIAFIRPEDTISIQRIKQQVSFLEKNPKVAAVGVQVTYIGEHGKSSGKSQFPLTHEDIYPTLLQPTIGFLYETALINRTILPLDIIKFTNTVYPHMYGDLFLKIAQYGTLANLKHYLYSYRQTSLQKKKAQRDIVLATMQLWLKSFTQYDYRPTLRSLFTQLAK